jgi:hypothetical protein
MMRHPLTWIVTVVFLLGLAAPVLAQTTTAPAPPAPAPAPAQKAPAKAEMKKVEKAKSASGTVKSASADSLVLTAKDKKDWTFALDKDTKITKAGKAATAADLAAEDTAMVTYTEADGKMHAKSVAAKPKMAAAKPKS